MKCPQFTLPPLCLSTIHTHTQVECSMSANVLLRSPAQQPLHILPWKHKSLFRITAGVPSFLYLYLSFILPSSCALIHTVISEGDCTPLQYFFKDLRSYNKSSDWLLQENGPVGQVGTSPEIFLLYRAHLVMIAHRILAASTQRKGVKNCPNLERTVQIRATAHAHDGRVPSGGAVFAGAFELTAWARPW
jgi:hypothetical protein